MHLAKLRATRSAAGCHVAAFGFSHYTHTRSAHRTDFPSDSYSSLQGRLFLRAVLLDSIWAEIRLQHAQWFSDPHLAQQLTFTLVGWSNDRMESIYSFNIVFPYRRAILLESRDLSDMTHSGVRYATIDITTDTGSSSGHQG